MFPRVGPPAERRECASEAAKGTEPFRQRRREGDIHPCGFSWSEIAPRQRARQNSLYQRLAANRRGQGVELLSANDGPDEQLEARADSSCGLGRVRVSEQYAVLKDADASALLRGALPAPELLSQAGPNLGLDWIAEYPVGTERRGDVWH